MHIGPVLGLQGGHSVSLLEQAGFGSLAPSEYMMNPAAYSPAAVKNKGKRPSVHNCVEQGCPLPPALALVGLAVSEPSRNPTPRL